MAIAGSSTAPQGSYEVEAPVNPQENLAGLVQYAATATPTPSRSSLIDSEFHPTSHLVNHMEGSPLTVDYYRQILGADDTAKPLQLGVRASNQYFEKIKNFIFRVTSPLATSQNTENNEFTVTGEGNIYWGLKPNIGDMFITDGGEGYLALLSITSVERLSYTKTAAYAVRFQITDRLDANKTQSEWMQDLEGKVTKVTVFEPSLLEQYDNPFVTEEDYLTFKGVEEEQLSLEEYFISKFWLPETQGYCIPNQVIATFDGFHSRFCRQIGFYDSRRHINVHQIGCLDYEQMFTLWDLMIEMSDRKLRLVTEQMGVYPSRAMRAQSANRGVGFSLYSSCLAPWDPLSISNEYTIPAAPDAFKRNKNDFDATVVPSYLPVDCDSSYVLSSAFYTGSVGQMCNFERIVTQMLKEEQVDVTLVVRMTTEYYKLPLLEQFYYGPILYTLLGYVRRNPKWK